MSSQCRGPFTPLEDSAAGIVEEGLQPGSLRLGASGPGNIAVVEEGETERFKKETKRLGTKLWETAKEIERHLGTD